MPEKGKGRVDPASSAVIMLINFPSPTSSNNAKRGSPENPTFCPVLSVNQDDLESKDLQTNQIFSLPGEPQEKSNSSNKTEQQSY